MTTSPAIDPDASLARLATLHPAASRVFHAHDLDFCCHGQESLGSACRRAGLDPADLIREIEQAPSLPADHWDERPLNELIDHLLANFHEAHRAELPRLTAMADKVADRHRDHPALPRGLADLLRGIHGGLEEHMQKEEQVLFPLIRSGRGHLAGMPIQVMETEHRDHAANLARLRKLTNDYAVPDGACSTWHALYLGLHALELELMQHIHLENHVLFPRCLQG